MICPECRIEYLDVCPGCQRTVLPEPERPTQVARQPSTTKTLNRSEIHGLRRVVYGLIYVFSLIGLFVGVVLVGSAVKFAFMGGSWLLAALGSFAIGLVLIGVCSVLMSKFIREGGKDITSGFFKQS